MIFAKLSTAITVPFGPVLDSTGAEYTGCVVGDVKIAKNNGTPAALNGSATLTHKEVGIYELALTTSDISAVGQATVTLSKTTYVAAPVTMIVLPALVYDSLIGGTDNLQVDTIQVGGTTQTAKDVGGAVPAAAAGASGGLLISGSNAGTTTLGAMTVTGALTVSNGIAVTCSTDSRVGLSVTGGATAGAGATFTGQGTGPGIYVAGGATASGLKCTSGVSSVSKAGLEAIGVGTSAAGINATGVAAGLYATASDGSGLDARSTGGNGHGIFCQGAANGSGLTASGGSDGNGIYAAGDVSGNGIYAVGGDGTLSAGVLVKSNATISRYGMFVEDGAVITNEHGDGLLISATSGDSDGLEIVGNGAGKDVNADIGGSVASVTGAVGSVTGAVGSVTGAVGSVTGAVGSVTGNVGGNVTGSVGSVATGGITSASFATGAITATAIAADAIGASELAADAVHEIVHGVWDDPITDHLTGGTTGAALNAAGSAGDPWSTPLPGAYGAGTAGKIIGTNLDTTISSRHASGAAVAKSPATLAAGDVSGNLPADIKAYTVQPTVTGATLSAAYDAAKTAASQTSVNTIDGIVDKLDTAMESDGGVYRFTTNALEQAPIGGGASAGDIADAVWNETLADHLGAGSTGEKLNAAAAAGDPWTTSLPGTYTGDQAGAQVAQLVNLSQSGTEK